MKKLMMGMSLAIAGLLFCGTVTAQDEELEKAAEHIEQMAEEFGEKIEAWAEEHSGELEAWAEKYSGQWEEWAAGFESKMERWAAEQEGVWEDWADEFSAKWEDWGAKLESGEIDPDEMGEVIERNLKMLGEMPIGPMIEGLMKEGMGGLKDAPWESLNDIQDMVQDSLELSLKGMEDMAKEGGADWARSSDEFRGVLEKMQKGLDVKLKKLDSESAKKLGKLKKVLAEKELSTEQREKILKMAETIKDARVRQAAEMKAKADAVRKEALAKRKSASKKADKARSGDDEALSKFNEALKKRAKAKNINKEALERVLEQARKQRDEMKSKESDLDALRDEIRKLRDEVKRLKKDRDDD